MEQPFSGCRVRRYPTNLPAGDLRAVQLLLGHMKLESTPFSGRSPPWLPSQRRRRPPRYAEIRGDETTKRLMFLLSLILGIHCVHAASDFNPLGFYVEGSVGRSNLRTSVASVYSPYDFDLGNTGWKALVGVRPIPLIAAEFAYVDFGHPTASANFGVYSLHADVLQRAQTLSALIFAPIPVPLLELYGRAGIARLQSSGNPYLYCPPGYMCPLIPYPDLRFNRTSTDFQYGAGLQVKLPAMALRLEYERISDSYGDPDLLSVGLVWTF